MSVIVYGVTGAQGYAQDDPRATLVSTWTGWDDSVWRISDHASGTFLLPGVRGLTEGPHERYADQAPGIAGSMFLGWRAGERPVFWPLAIFQDATSLDWVERDRAFWRTLRPGTTGVWTVTAPSGSSRTLRCRFDNDGNHAFDHDPMASGWATYQVYLVADEDPFWRGEEIVRRWEPTTPSDFVPVSAGPPFHISEPSELTIPNPGDVGGWVQWVSNGPSTTLDLGVDGAVVEIPFEVPDGKRLTLDTRPTEQVAILGDPDPDDPFGVLDGEDVTDLLGEADFAEVPAESTTTLSVEMDGAGYVLARLVPGYWRAW
jgi:hypothetical protein